MKKQIILLLSIILNTYYSNIVAQPRKEWQDTPTPAEIAVHNQPYLILQKEIENKLCDNDWAINTKYQFLILKGGPDEDVILRGTTVHYFTPVDRGIMCEVDMKYGSSIYTANANSFNALMKIKVAQINKSLQILAKAQKNNLKYTAEDSAVMDKIKIVNDKADLEMARLLDERKLAIIKMLLNSSWTEPQKGRQYYLDGGIDFYAGKKLPHLEGVGYATLFMEKPWKDNPDTLCEATIYIGNWPAQTDLKRRFAFHFVHIDKTPWTDKQHSGQPFLENMKIIITGESYESVMKVIHSIDWTKLNALVK